MVQNASITAFAVSELLTENQQWGGRITQNPRLGIIIQFLTVFTTLELHEVSKYMIIV